MKKTAVVLIFFLLHASIASTQSYPWPVVPTSAKRLPDFICRDFISLAESSLPICDFVMTDKLKTELLSLLITEQKNIDLMIKDTTVTNEEKERLSKLKPHLVNIEQFTIQKMTEICNLKGRIIKEGANLVSGCAYNQFNKIKKTILLIKKPLNFAAMETHWPAVDEQIQFDTFINDLLLDLAEKNKQDQKDNTQIKILMLEILKIYGGNGLSLYSAFWGICGLEAIVQTSSGDMVDHQTAITCEEKYLSDLRQVLFLAI